MPGVGAAAGDGRHTAPLCKVCASDASEGRQWGPIRGVGEKSTRVDFSDLIAGVRIGTIDLKKFINNVLGHVFVGQYTWSRSPNQGQVAVGATVYPLSEV